MPNVRDHPLIDQSEAGTSLAKHAEDQRFPPPVSLRALLEHVDEQRFHADVTTAGLEALGGTVDVVIRSDGSYDIHVHMHDSGLVSYSFRLVIVLTGLSSVTSLNPDDSSRDGAILFECTGDVEGTEVSLYSGKAPRRDFDWRDSGWRLTIRNQWKHFRDGHLDVAKAYEHAGLVGTIEEIERAWLTFLFGTAVLAIPPVAAIVLVSSTVGRLTGERFLGPGGLVGLAAGAGTFYLFGPAMVIPAFVGGTIAGELVLPRHRPLEEPEIDFARAVFGDTIPYDRVILTDMVGFGGRPFAFPGIDGSILVNIGVDNAFDDPTRYVKKVWDPDLDRLVDSCKDVRGQLFIHEMTHAWQIARGTLEGFICDAAIESRIRELEFLDGKDAVYRYGSAQSNWSTDFNMEQQASVVEEWFGGTRCSGFDTNMDRSPMNTTDPYFRYIEGNIRLGLA